MIQFSTNGVVKEHYELSPFREFAKLQIHASNRNVSMRHVNAIEEMMRNCDLHDVYPGIVSQEFEIMDSQHRYQARRSLNLPIFVTHSTMTIADVAGCNDRTRAYTLRDIFDTFAVLGVGSYVKVRELAKECDNLPFQCIVNAGTIRGSKYGSQDLRNGFYHLQRREFVREVSNKCALVVDKFPQCDFARFYICMSYLLDVKAFSFDRFMDRMAVAGDMVVASQDMDRTIKMLEEVYNFNMQSGFSFDVTQLRRLSNPAPEFETWTGLDAMPARRLAKKAGARVVRLGSAEGLVAHPATRALDKRRVDKIARSLAEGNWLREYPIIIDNAGRVMDGNRRLAAARQVGADVWVIEASDVSMNMIACAACLQRNWYVRDYVKHYAEEGSEDYQRLRKIAQNNRAINIRQIATALSLVPNGHSVSKLVMLGDFEIKSTDVWYQFRDAIGALNDAKLAKGATFRNELLRLMIGDSKFPVDQLVEKLNKYGGAIMGRCANNSEVRSGIVAAINYRQQTQFYEFSPNVLTVKGSG